MKPTRRSDSLMGNAIDHAAIALAPVVLGCLVTAAHLWPSAARALSPEQLSPEQRKVHDALDATSDQTSTDDTDKASQPASDDDTDTETPVQTRTLKNGLTIIAIPDDSLPITTIEIAVRHGAFAENDEFNGLSHLYEHMCFKANEAIPNQEAFLSRQRELGIVFNGSTSTERVNYYFTLPSDNLKPGLEFMSSAVRSPLFKKKEFRKEKQVVLSEFNRAASSPSFKLRQAMRHALWGEHASRKDVIGDKQVIANATIEQMRTIKNTFYVPNNTALVIAGDVSADRAFKLGEQIFGDWTKSADPFETYPVPEHASLSDSTHLQVDGDVKVPTVQFAFHGPSVDERPEMTYAADVLSYILGQSTSKFHKRLVDKGPALGAGLSYYTQANTGPIYASAQANPDEIKQTVRDLYTELHKLTDPDYFTDDQLDNAKTILATQEIYNREKTSSYAHTVSFWWAVDSVDYYRGYVDNLRAVTREDIAEYVETYIIDQPYVMAVQTSPETSKKLGLDDDALRKLVEEARQGIDKPTNSSDSTQNASR